MSNIARTAVLAEMRGCDVDGRSLQRHSGSAWVFMDLAQHNIGYKTIAKSPPMQVPNNGGAKTPSRHDKFPSQERPRPFIISGPQHPIS